MSEQYKITEEQKKLLLQISAQTLPDNPSRDGYSAEQIRSRLYKPYAALVDLINGVFGTAYSDVSEIQEAIENGDFFARSFVQWSATYTYGANEITYYPVGTYGALVKSVVASNTNHEPYTDGVLNSTYWAEVLNFDGALSKAEEYADAAEAAQAAAEAAQTAAETAKNSAQGYAEAAQTSADAAETSQEQAAGAATAAENSATAAAGSATAAANSATEAQEYAQQAKDYAQKHYAVYPSFDALPRPGDSAFIYLVPVDEAETNNNYTEYLWITETSSYESIGTVNDIDLSGYAQINGTYAGMTVGNATNAQTAQNAQQLGGVAASQYAQISGTYSGMTVGKATNADNAIKATQDASGNVITATYATKTENNAKYTKPSTGIPKTDLASAVQTSLNKADTALQSVPLATASAVGGVKPVAKTDTMTQSVGVDANGALFTAPSGGGSIEYMTDDEVDALFGGSIPTPVSFATDDWATIASAAESGNAQQYYNVGDEKTIQLSTGEQVTLVILGFNHDDLTSGGKAGMTIGMKELLATKYRMNATGTNAGGWDESEMRTSTMVTLLSQLPSDLQGVIKQVNKKATAGGESTSITTSADKLWLLARVEVEGTTKAGYADEGERYEYWKTVKDGTVAADRIKYLSNGSSYATIWWLRSPYVINSTNFSNFSSEGDYGYAHATLTRGVSFCFCV